jgi:preprotein translocase subunit SecA
MLDRIKTEVVTILSRIQVRSEEDVHALEEQRRQHGQMEFQHDEASAMEQSEEQEEEHTPFVREGRKVGRNEPCPCGSGKKYKQCHGKLS